MAEKLVPHNKPMGKGDGIKMPSSHSTISTPNSTFGRYFGENKPASETKKGGSLFKK